ncbi:MAG: CRISPR-associated helicase Cas3', partial [Synergistaceae bacterium]|nr:CRISPR-associated helicase Cas3' [Synergistaceae bacterium]
MAIFAKKPVVIEGVEHGKTLLQHTFDVLEALHALFGDEERPTLLAKQWLRFFRISESDAALFFQNARIAVILHDLGKSNEHFQAAVRGRGDQTLRHEFLGGWLISRKPFRRVLEAVENADFQIVRASVMGHHLKLGRGIAETADCERPSVALLPEGIQKILDLLTKTVRVSSVPKDAIPIRINVKGEAGQFAEIEHDLENDFDDDGRTGLLRAVRTALILADAAGSGLAREMGRSVPIPLADWIGKAFDDGDILTGQQIEEKVVAPRCRQIEAKRGKPFVFSDFQFEAAELPDRALLLASCGSGKTLAAWKWGMGVASRRIIRRFIFLYPTRGTATEGFKDYVAWAPESDGALLHGTSKYELQDMFDNTDSRYDKDFLANDRLFAVGFWQKRIFSATVDQFLAFMGHDYRSTCLLPLLAESAVIFDEVHSFDARLFSALLGFLREFDVPALCMTASLPPGRIKQLEESGLEVFPKKPESYADLWKNSSALRYTVRRATRDEAVHEVAEEWRKGGKILWVVNTVKRCQEAAEELAAMLPEARIICYHSRFRLKDRQAAHKELIAAFREDGPMIAVTTQVCEMSLDLSATLLVSEFAPLTALIQRMGRCNRILEIEGGGRVLLYPPESGRPYSDDDMKNVGDFVNEIDGQFVSQVRLQELLEKYSPATREMIKRLSFIEEDGFARSSDKGIRDIDDHSVSAILERDIGEYWRLWKSGCPVDGLVLPAPFKST